MKKITLITFLSVFAFQFGNSQVMKNFDAALFDPDTGSGIGYMSWTGPSGDGESGWGVNDLVATVDAVGGTATLKPNRINDLNSYWQQVPAGLLGEKIMTASFYVEDMTLGSTNFDWTGNITSFGLDNQWTVAAFIKVFAAGYSSLLADLSVPITTTGDFTLNYDGSAGGAIVQYGFVTVGPNVNPEATYDVQYDAFGSVGVAPATLGVNDININDFNIYPNPSNNVWNIEGKEIINEIQVHDVLGKRVMSLTPRANDVSIDASTLPSGLYFARMTTDLGSGSIKLIKN